MIVFQLSLVASNILEDATVFLDKNSQKNISWIMNNSDLFEITSESQKEYINYGYIFEDTIWVRFEVNNSTNKESTQKIVLNSPNVDILNLHFLKDGQMNTLNSGVLQREHFDNRLFFNFETTLDAGENQVYFLEYQSMTHSSHFSLKLQSIENYFDTELKNQIILIGFFGALLALIVYNLVLFFISKNSIYAYYSLFVFSLFVHHLTLSGMVYYFVPREWILFHLYTPIYYIAFSLITAIFFVYHFLALQEYKKIRYMFWIYGSIMIVMLLLNSVQFYLLEYATTYALIFSLTLQGMGVYLFISRNSLQDKYFVVAWSVVWIGIIATLLFYLGVISKPIYYLYELSIAGEALLFSVVLGEQLNEQEKIIQEQSKLAAMGEMIQNISHQWRQPLSEINSVAMKIEGDFLQNSLTQQRLDDNLEQIETVTTYMSQTIEDFLHYFREDNTFHNCNLEAVIKKAVRLQQNSFEQGNIEVTITNHNSINCEIIEGQFVQVLVALLNNAKDVLMTKKDSKKVIMIELFNNKVTIEDSGGGIKKQHLKKIFEPYFTTKFKSKGVGVGLYMAKIMIEKNMGGTLSVNNSKLGAKFTIDLEKDDA